MKLIGLSFALLASPSLASGVLAEKIFKDFDRSFYYPQREKLRDFRVDIRIDDLSRQLGKQLLLGKLKDVFFKLYWLKASIPHKDDYKRVEVLGMPDGFSEVKLSLTNNILYYLNFIVPILQQKQFKNYKLSLKKTETSEKNNEIVILARGPLNLTDSNEALLTFSREKRLKKMTIKRPSGVEVVELKMTKKPWSNGKWVLDQSLISQTYGSQLLKSVNNITYKVISGYGLPKKIKTKSEYEIIQSGKEKREKHKKDVISVINFSNWKINKGLKESEFKK